MSCGNHFNERFTKDTWLLEHVIENAACDSGAFILRQPSILPLAFTKLYKSPTEINKPHKRHHTFQDLSVLLCKMTFSSQFSEKWDGCLSPQEIFHPLLHFNFYSGRLNISEFIKTNKV